ncbi:MAG: PAS domain S-box protein [Gammaproteobacteria bacterium]|nr:PAS domain S-box protein [Gammaproteobacteria bacterium]
MNKKPLASEIAKVAESDVFFRNLLESAPDAMVIADASGHMALVNAQTEAMFGYARSELIGFPIEKLLPENIRDKHIQHRTSYQDTPAVRPMGQGMQLVGRRSDGTEFPVEISLSPVQTEAGQFVSSVIRDVTVRQRMEQDIIAAQRAAERANKANSAFLAAASHDLRQPVQALSLLNGALRRTVQDERALQMIEHQDASLTGMTNLLNSLLDISRLDAGAVVPEFEEFPMQRLIDRLSAEFARQAQHKGLNFSSLACDAVVRSDPNLLAEVITNLVSNAIRYTVSGDVRLECIEEGGHCHLQVSDTGIGIESDQLEQIFTEFHQCKSTGSSKEGFGLGLAIVRRLTDLLDHRIDVDSDPGKGSRFTVMVPIIEDAVAGDEDDEEGLHRSGNSGGLIILIEDDVNVADAWGMLLEAEGYRVAMAASAAEASALVQHLDEQPVLLISDFHLLGGSTGIEAVRLIRAEYERDIPAFIVTGDTSKIVRDSRLLDNCTLMSKPVDTNRLLIAATYATQTGVVPED